MSKQLESKDYAKRPNQEKILCPVLAMLYNYGSLQPDDDGCVTAEALGNALHAHIGLGKKQAKQAPFDAIWPGLKKKDPQWRVNLFDLGGKNALPGREIDNQPTHRVSLGVRNPGHKILHGEGASDCVNPERLEELMDKYCNKDGVFTLKELRPLCRDIMLSKERNAAGNPRAYSRPGSGLVGGALSTLFERFARREKGKKRYMTKDDFRALYVDAKAPEGWPGVDGKPPPFHVSTIVSNIIKLGGGIFQFFRLVRGKADPTLASLGLSADGEDLS